jgi:arsenate reductase
MPAADRIYNVLFLCTGNSARSILGEALLNHVAGSRFRAYSAGSHPKGTVHPMTLEVLEAAGISTAGLRSKPWDEFAGADAPKMDFVFTVCDQAAGEACPLWPGQPMTAHWGIEDPAAVEGSDMDKERAFVQAAKYLKNRITLFLNLPFGSLDQMTLGQRLRDIGRVEGSTAELLPFPGRSD